MSLDTRSLWIANAILAAAVIWCIASSVAIRRALGEMQRWPVAPTRAPAPSTQSEDHVSLKLATIRVMGDPDHGSFGRRISMVDYPFVNGREYGIAVTARGDSITVAIDGRLLNQVADSTYHSGGIGLTVWEWRSRIPSAAGEVLPVGRARRHSSSDRFGPQRPHWLARLLM